MRWLLFLLLMGSILCAQEPERILVTPFQVPNPELDAWEGLALALAFQAHGEDRLLDQTAYRRQLTDYGLSQVTPTTLASKIKLAADLRADLLVNVTLLPHQVEVAVIRMDDLNATTWALPAHDPLAGNTTLANLAQSLGMGLTEAKTDDLDFYRAWASTYFADSQRVAREIMVRLIEHELAGAAFLNEYVDLFGDPAGGAMDPKDRIYWRDLYVAKAFYSGAVSVSTLVLEDRHNPADFIVHADILSHLNETEQACRYVARAESFGFVVDTSHPLHSLCHP